MVEQSLNEVDQQSEDRKPGPAQFNLLTGQAELIPIEVPEPQDWGTEVSIDKGICLVKSEDGSQLLLSGYGLFLSKKSERLLVRKGKDVIYQIPYEKPWASGGALVFYLRSGTDL